MTDLIHLAAAFFQFKDWTIHNTPDPHMIITDFEGENGSWRVFAVSHPNRPQMAFYSLFPITCPKAHETQLLELLHRANEGMILGNFEYVFDHREIRYKTSLDITGLEPTLQMCNPMTYYNFLGMDQYFTPILAVIRDGFTVSDAMYMRGRSPEAIPEKRRASNRAPTNPPPPSE